MDTSPLPEESVTLASVWKTLRQNGLPPEMTVSEMVKAKALFYAGATAFCSAITDARDRAKDADEFSLIMGARRDELRQAAVDCALTTFSLMTRKAGVAE